MNIIRLRFNLNFYNNFLMPFIYYVRKKLNKLINVLKIVIISSTFINFIFIKKLSNEYIEKNSANFLFWSLI